MSSGDLRQVELKVVAPKLHYSHNPVQVNEIE